MIKIGEKTKLIRAFLGLSQEELAQIIGSNNYKLVSRWETREILIPLSHYKEKVDVIYEKVVFAKEHLRAGEKCAICSKETDLLRGMLDKKHRRFLCKSCYYTIYG